MDLGHYDLLISGVSEWDAWRTQNPGVRPDLLEADLRWADLEGANLEGADLRGAVLKGANLRGADLWGADLEGADLEGADLRNADLRRANLRRADLRGANLRGAHLEGADLEGVQFDAALTAEPLQISGLRWHVIVFDDAMRIGCQGPYTLDAWSSFVDEEIREMDDDALDWWREWKTPVMALARAHEAKVKGGRS